MDALSKLAGSFTPAQLKALKAFKKTHGVEKLKDMVAEGRWVANLGEGPGKLGTGKLGLASWGKKPLAKHSSVESYNGDFRMNALEKYAAKKKLTKKVLEGLYGKKPTEGKSLRRLGALLGFEGGGRVGAGVGIASTSLGRKAFSASEAEVAKAFSEAGLSDLGKAIGAAGAGTLLGGGLGAKAGHMGGKALDKRLFKKRLAKHTRRKVLTNVGLGGAAAGVTGGGAAALASIIAKKKKSKKKG